MCTDNTNIACRTAYLNLMLTLTNAIPHPSGEGHIRVGVAILDILGEEPVRVEDLGVREVQGVTVEGRGQQHHRSMFRDDKAP